MRAIAALLVVFHHAAWKGEQYSTNPLAWFSIGSIGVDLFFIISGFIMCHTVNNKKVLFSSFIKARFIRIVPLYWVLTSMALVVFLFFPEKVNSSGGVTDVLASYTLLPSEGKYLINNGWTLSYEFLFYLIFSSCLLIKNPKRYLLPCLIISLLCFWGNIAVDMNYVVSFLTSEYLLEFAFGILVFYFSKKISPNIYIAIFLIACSILMACFVNANLDRLDQNRIILYGLPSLVFFVGMILLEPLLYLKRNSFIAQSFKILGDSSYSLYLFHPFVLVVCSIVLQYLKIHEYGYTFISILVVSSLISGYLCFLILEKPLLKLMKNI